MKVRHWAVVWAVVAVALAVPGCSCGESEPEPPVVVQQNAKPAPAPAAAKDPKPERQVGDSIMHAPADYVGTVAIKAPRYAQRTVDVAELTQEIQLFMVDQGRYPKSLEEFVEHRGKPLPELRGHMTYSYDPNSGRLRSVPIE